MSKSVKAFVVTFTLLVMMCAVAILAVYIYSNNVFNAQCLTGHDMAVISAMEATCTTDGRTEGAYCNRCNKVFVESEIIPAFGHNVFESLGRDATCTSNGLTPKQECSVCGVLLAEQKVIQPFGHQFGDWVTTQAASCAIDGAQVRRCSTCGAEEKQTLKQTGHTYVFSRSAPATCTIAQINTLVCSSCGNITTESVGGPLGHLLGSYKYNNDATCTSDGTQTARCANCNYAVTSTAAGTKKDHQVVTTFGYAATCTSAGMTNGTKCGECGITLTAQQQIPAAGHAWVEATYSSPKKCTTCGVTTGEKLEVVTPIEKNKVAIELLAQFLVQNQNYNLNSQYPSFFLHSSKITDTATLAVYLTPIGDSREKGVAVMAEIREGATITALCSCFLDPNTPNKTAFNYSSIDAPLQVKGSGFIVNTAFGDDYDLNFSEYDGSAGAKTSSQNLCKATLLAALKQVDLLFLRKIPIKNGYVYSLVDLNFISLYE